jgi:hypothetical protein
MGALAALDDRGRWAVAGDLLWNGGTVPAAWVAGLLVERAGMLPLAGWALFTGGVCLVLVARALRRFQSQHASASSVELSALTLRIYAHALRTEETDLTFAEFGDPKRPYAIHRKESEIKDAANYLKQMVTRARFAELRSKAVHRVQLA